MPRGASAETWFADDAVPARHSSATALGQLRSPAAWLLVSQFFPLSIGLAGGEFRLEADLAKVLSGP